MNHSRHYLQFIKKKEETQLHVLQPRTVDTLYVVIYFWSTDGNCAITIFPQGIGRHIHTVSVTYVLWSLLYVSTIVGTCFTSRLYMLGKNFIFPQLAVALETCGRDEKFRGIVSHGGIKSAGIHQPSSRYHRDNSPWPVLLQHFPSLRPYMYYSKERERNSVIKYTVICLSLIL